MLKLMQTDIRLSRLQLGHIKQFAYHINNTRVLILIVSPHVMDLPEEQTGPNITSTS